MSLNDYITSNYKGKKNISKLIKVIDGENAQLKLYADELQDQAVISKATWGIAEWEKELNIEHKPDYSLEERREVIGARIRGRGTTTKAMLINAAEAFSGGEVDIIEKPEEFEFIIKFVGTKGVPTNMGDFTDMLDTIKPAHLVYAFEYTYTTWGELKERTWDEVAQYTWGEILVN